MNRPIHHPLQLKTPADSVVQGSPYSDSDGSRLPLYLTRTSNAPTVKSTENDEENLNDLKGQISADLRGRLDPPLDLVGGRHGCFPGAGTSSRTRQISAVIDTEMGTPAATPKISSGGVRYFVIPPRGSRR